MTLLKFSDLEFLVLKFNIIAETAATRLVPSILQMEHLYKEPWQFDLLYLAIPLFSPYPFLPFGIVVE